MRLVGWLMVLAGVFVLGFSVRVVSAGTSEGTAADGLVGILVSLVVLGVGSALVVRSRPR
jgi:hypothetical protein